MKHQLKNFDAVRCESIDEWLEIIRLSIAAGIKISVFHRLEQKPLLYYTCDTDNTLYYTCDSDDNKNEYVQSHIDRREDPDLRHLSFNEFCAKLKGEYNESSQIPTSEG